MAKETYIYMAPAARAGSVVRDFGAVKTTLLVVFLPLVLLPLPILSDSTEAKCAYGLVLMAVFWITECIPLPVTALLPVVVFPLFGVMKASDVAGNYIKQATMFIIGGLTLAIAIENCQLHKRIALKTLTLFGVQPRWLMLGFMLPTWFLSLWISNIATTAMMIPIVNAVLDELRKIKYKSNEEMLKGEIELKPGEKQQRLNLPLKYETSSSSQRSDADVIGTDEEKDDTTLRENNVTAASPPGFDPSDRSRDTMEFTRLCKGFCLCIAYSANIGGIGTLAGSAPNVIMQVQADIIFNTYGLESGVNFVNWMVFALPVSLLCIMLAWMWLQTLFLGKSSLLCCTAKPRDGNEAVGYQIRREYEKLGRMSFAEKVVLVHFVILVLAYLTMSIPYVGGWGQFFPKGYIGSSVSAILVAVSLFVFPSKRPSVFCWRRSGEASRSVPSLLTWKTVERGMPWGVLLLIGGGTALADASQKSGLSQWICNQLTVFSSLDPSITSLLLSLLVAAVTEVTTNIATVTLFLPILGNLALSLNVNPLCLMFPCAVAASFAFMLPVATPPNALVFATGYVKVTDMAIAGVGMNVVCVLVLALATNSWGDAYFDLFTLPQGFPVNSSAVAL
ncbi:solute carrier family 13 member 2-like isoform X2 [Haliotis rufescens]|nr:solute carrier family 13 member 2-like isoform X2 [Haliotis rufescens]